MRKKRSSVEPSTNTPLVEVIEPSTNTPLVAVKFRRQDGCYSPREPYYLMPEKQAHKFINQGSAKLVEDGIDR